MFDQCAARSFARLPVFRCLDSARALARVVCIVRLGVVAERQTASRAASHILFLFLLTNAVVDDEISFPNNNVRVNFNVLRDQTFDSYCFVLFVNASNVRVKCRVRFVLRLFTLRARVYNLGKKTLI